MTSEKDIIEEFWKITGMRENLKLLRKTNEDFKITRGEIEDKQIKINLMQEAEKFGRESERARIKEEIKKILKKNTINYQVGSNEFEELLKVIGEKEQ